MEATDPTSGGIPAGCYARQNKGEKMEMMIMTKQTQIQQTQTQTPELPEHVLAACEIAVTDGTPPDKWLFITAAKKDLSARGSGPWWYRLVWRNSQWQYVSHERLPVGTIVARDRRCAVRGEVWPGELVIQHDRGGPIDVAYLVVDSQLTPLVECQLSRTRDGQLRLTLPDGRQVVRPNPRRS